MVELSSALRCLVAAVVVSAAALAAAPGATASPVLVRDGNGGNVFSGNGVGSVNLTIKVDGTNQAVSAGPFALQYSTNGGSSWLSLLTYCLEPDETLNVGSTPTSGNLVASLSASTEYAAKAGDIARLYRTYFADSLTSATKAAAFQVALWEVAYDTGMNLAAGAFRLVTTGAVATQAAAYLGGWLPSGDVGVILRVGNQDLLVDVPEPVSLALFGLGLAGLGLARTRGRRANPA